MIKGWAVKWRQEGNNPDGYGREHLVLFDYKLRRGPRGNYNVMVFATRREARAFAKERYGYIARRADLRRWPHDWRSPLVVRVTLEVKDINDD